MLIGSVQLELTLKVVNNSLASYMSFYESSKGLNP